MKLGCASFVGVVKAEASMARGRRPGAVESYTEHVLDRSLFHCEPPFAMKLGCASFVGVVKAEASMARGRASDAWCIVKGCAV